MFSDSCSAGYQLFSVRCLGSLKVPWLQNCACQMGWLFWLMRWEQSSFHWTTFTPQVTWFLSSFNLVYSSSLLVLPRDGGEQVCVTRFQLSSKRDRLNALLKDLYYLQVIIYWGFWEQVILTIKFASKDNMGSSGKTHLQAHVCGGYQKETVKCGKILKIVWNQQIKSTFKKMQNDEYNHVWKNRLKDVFL